MKTITLLTSGTRGDVVPYLALGLGLQEAGYRVRLAAPLGFRELVEPSGLDFAPFEGNPSDLMVNRSEPLALGRSLIRSVRATRTFMDQARALHARMLGSAVQACRGSQLLVYGLATLWGAHLAEGLSIPRVRAVLQPLGPTQQFASALLPFRLSFGRHANWLSHWIVTQAIWLAWRAEIDRVRRTHFGLPRAPWLDPSLRARSEQPLTLNGFSQVVVPRPADWNEKQVITGYWRTSGGHQPDPVGTTAIERFIERFPARTIAMGLGSPGTRDFEPVLRTIEQALLRADAQAVIALPTQFHERVSSQRLFPISYVPHEWLYPRVRLAVHHGGAGTTAASLHAGIPTLVLPQAVDQFFWGERVNQLGVGPQPIPQRSLTAPRLAHAIQAALTDEPMQLRAAQIGRTLCRENGVETAVHEIQRIIQS